MGSQLKMENLKLEDTGLFSDASIELRNFIIFNKLKYVKDFIEKVDNNTYTSTTYYDVLLEARGLSDLLKLKYFNTPLVTDIYLDEKIKYMEFDNQRLASSICTYGIILPNHEKKTIYHIITRLGFNDKERQKILDASHDIEGMKLIDLLYEAHDRIIGEQTKISEVLCNKIMIILKYYLLTRRNKNGSKFLEQLEITINEFNDVLARKYRLEYGKKKNNGVKK